MPPRRRSFRQGALALLLAAPLCACSGSIEGMGTETGTPGGPSTPGGPTSPGGPSTPGSPVSPGGPSTPGNPTMPGTQTPSGANTLGGVPIGKTSNMPLRRLSKVEYENTLKDLLGPKAAMNSMLPLEPMGPASYRSPSEINGVERDLFETGANNAANAVASTLIPACASAAMEATCASDFITSFGKRAFRRPLLADESKALTDLYTKLKGQTLTHAEAMKTIASAMLQTPQFLNHWELGDQKSTVTNGRIQLNRWEIASRLSYLFWGTMPDQDLFSAAESGQLDTPDGIDKQARRLLADKTRAAYFATNIFEQWVGMEKLDNLLKETSVIADFSTALKNAYRDETDQFVAKAVLEDGKLSALLTSKDSFINAGIAGVYDIKGITGDALKPQTLPAERPGLFTRGAFLAIKALPQEGSPVHRGKVISTRLLCNRIEPPPPALMVMPPAFEAGKTERQRYDVHGKTPGCANCHNMMDPYGFALGNFDAVGRYREKDQGQTIDASGSIENLDGKKVSFKNASELMTALAGSTQVQGCATAQFMLLALNRPLTESDRTPLEQVAKTFTSSGADLRELAVALVKSDSFRFRTPDPMEITQ